MKIVVTGASGFIGCNLIRELNKIGQNQIIAVDQFSRGDSFKNLIGCDFEDFIDKDEFRKKLISGFFDGKVSTFFHQGACSNTMETDSNYMIENNYSYSQDILSFCEKLSIPLIYASSAAIYGGSKNFSEVSSNENPLNIYGFSKYLFDKTVKKKLGKIKNQIVGLRYFNVYGPWESHKKGMASVAYHFYNQYMNSKKIRLFEGDEIYPNGEQRRDFVSVEDITKINLWFFKNKNLSGIYNCGTGTASTFNQVAVNVINSIRILRNEDKLTLEEMISSDMIEYIPIPKELKEKYQNYTCSDETKLRDIGYTEKKLSLGDGINRYVKWLHQKKMDK